MGRPSCRADCHRPTAALRCACDELEVLDRRRHHRQFAVVLDGRRASFGPHPRAGDRLVVVVHGWPPPTIKSLEFLVPHADTASAMAAAGQLDRPTAIHPKLRRNEAGRITGVSLPGDEDYADLD